MFYRLEKKIDNLFTSFTLEWYVRSVQLNCYFSLDNKLTSRSDDRWRHTSFHIRSTTFLYANKQRNQCSGYYQPSCYNIILLHSWVVICVSITVHRGCTSHRGLECNEREVLLIRQQLSGLSVMHSWECTPSRPVPPHPIPSSTVLFCNSEENTLLLVVLNILQMTQIKQIIQISNGHTRTIQPDSVNRI